jgi:hypothetical protein
MCELVWGELGTLVKKMRIFLRGACLGGWAEPTVTKGVENLVLLLFRAWLGDLGTQFGR